MIRRVLHPSDFSKASSAALKKAVEMAKADRAELMVVHVVNPIVPTRPLARQNDLRRYWQSGIGIVRRTLVASAGTLRWRQTSKVALTR